MGYRFVGRYVRGFGRFMYLNNKYMNRSQIAEKRYRILAFWHDHGIKACMDAFDVKRSTLFLWKKQLKEEGNLESKSTKPKNVRIPATPWRITDAVCQMRKAFPHLGKDKIASLLKRNGIEVSASTVGRIISRYNLPSSPRIYVARNKAKKNKDKLRKPKDYEINAPGDLVGMDTIVIQEHRRKIYIICAIDYFSRLVVSRTYKSPSSRSSTDLLKRMQIALGIPIKAVNTDNGSEFMAEYQKTCDDLNIKHFHTYPRTPKMNGMVERFNRTIQEEATLPSLNSSIETWNYFVNHFVMVYNFFRPHYALNYDTPVDKFLGHNKSNMLWTHTDH